MQNLKTLTFTFWYEQVIKLSPGICLCYNASYHEMEWKNKTTRMNAGAYFEGQEAIVLVWILVITLVTNVQ